MPADASAPPAPARVTIRTLDWLNGLVVVALAVFLASFAVRNSDHWLHLAAGRLISTGNFPFGTDPFSAYSPAPVWINHSWLYDFLVFRLQSLAGGAGVVIAKSVVIGLLAVVLLSCRRRDGDRWLPTLFTALALLTMSPRLLMQPTIISFLFLGILMRLLVFESERANRWRNPVCIAILFALWVNLDGGFVFGLGVVALWFLGGILQRAMPFDPRAIDSNEGQSSIAGLALVLILAVLACLLNPYGYKALSLPSDWSFLKLPHSLRTDELFRELFRSPFEKAYTSEVAGTIPGGSYFLLLGLGLGSFILNSGAWQWNRALVWLAFAGLSMWLTRFVPYFAVVAAPITVWNLQTSSSRRIDVPLDDRARFTRSFLGAFGRFATFLFGVGLLVLAWPGGLARDAGTRQAERRVAWDVIPDESSVRAAGQLAKWYETGQLRAGEAQGFHLPFQFGYYCAWFCPAEKIQFDIRMTNPDSAAAYVATRRSLLNLRDRQDATPKLQAGLSHLVLTGRTASILGREVLVRNDQFPLWAIVGQSLITGWTPSATEGPTRQLRLDPVQLAMTHPVNAPWVDPSDPPSLSAIDRFFQPAPTTPPEAYEAALWLTARDAAGARAGPTLSTVQFVAAIARAAPTTTNELFARIMDPFIGAQLLGPLNEAWQRSPDGRLSRVAPLLALRSARRGIQANPADFESFLRAAAATSLFDGDQEMLRVRQTSFNFLQEATAARQALQRMPIAAAYGTYTAPDELAMHTALQQYYERASVFDGTEIPPLDLLLESRTRSLELENTIFDRLRKDVHSDQLAKFEETFVAERQKKRERLEALRAEVKRRSDEYETRAAKMNPGERAELAARFGLPREALNVLRNANPQELRGPNIVLMLHLLLLAGEAGDARAILQGPGFNPITSLPPELQPAFRALALQTAVAIGDNASAIEMLERALENQPQSLGPPLAGTLQWMVFPDLGTSPLTRGITTPLWFGLFSKTGGTRGQLLELQLAIQHYCNNYVRLGLLAVQQGDIAKAKQSFRRSLDIGRNSLFELRGTALRWLELFQD
jgi:tetratricopeptide (TPR) repeat protein